MKRIMLVIAALGALVATPALAETYFGFHIGINSAPPPPRVYFREEPRVIFVPETRVYVVRDYHGDMFRYGRYWYVSHDGYWYRAKSHRGKFRVIDARHVPRAIYAVPGHHWKEKRWARDRDRDRDGYRDRDRNRRGRDRDRRDG